MEACIIVNGRREKVPDDTHLAEFPRFLRFERISFAYNYSCTCNSARMWEKCQSLIYYLQTHKTILKGTNSIRFIVVISEHRSCFLNHHQFLYHFRNELLPIFDSSYAYIFEICYNAHFETAANVVESILQMPPIDRCLSTTINIIFGCDYPLIRLQLPIEAITNWLHPEFDGINEERDERFLQISAHVIRNIQEQCDNLKKVIKIFTLVKT